MRKELLSKCASLINGLYLPACLLFLCVLAYNHFQLISYELPLDYNEAGMLTITATIAAGENPYSLANTPARTSVYPVLYNMLVAPAALVFGNTFLVHRVVVAVFMLAACVLVFLLTYRAGASAKNSFAASILFYAGLLYYSTPIAGPTSLGLFLFLSSLIIPQFYGFSNRSLFLALILGVMAFYGKQYFLAGLGYLALYLFIAVSKKKAVIFGFFAVVLFLTSIAIVNYTSPYFLDSTVFAQKHSADIIGSDHILLKQLLQYGKIYLPLFILLVVQLLSGTFTVFQTQKSGIQSEKPPGLLNLRDIDAPLLARKPDYIWHCFACSLLVIVFVIGKNPANHLSYLFQLLSPFLLAGTFIILSRSTRFVAVSQLLAVLAFYSLYSILPHDFSLRNVGNWAKVKETIASAHSVFAPPAILGEILKNDGVIYNNGHTIYFALAAGKPAFFAPENPGETVDQVWKNYTDSIYSKIAAQEFDLVILDQWTLIPDPSPGLYENMDGLSWLKKYYRRREVIPISLANRPGGGNYALQIWEPIPNSSHLDIDEP